MSFRVLPVLRENYTVGDDGSREFFANTWVAMTFTPFVVHGITSVKMLLYCIGSPGVLTVSIRATAAGLPSGADLVSNTFDADTLPAGNGNEIWIEVLLTELALSASTKYAIVCRNGGDASNLVGWRKDASAPTYVGGERCDSVNAGAVWTNPTGDDYMFEEWGI